MIELYIDLLRSSQFWKKHNINCLLKFSKHMTITMIFMWSLQRQRKRKIVDSSCQVKHVSIFLFHGTVSKSIFIIFSIFQLIYFLTYFPLDISPLEEGIHIQKMLAYKLVGTLHTWKLNHWNSMQKILKIKHMLCKQKFL